MTTFTYLEPLSDGHSTFWARMVLKRAAGDLRVGRVRFVTGAEMAGRLGGALAQSRVEVVILPAELLARMTTGSLLSRGIAQWAAARRAAAEGVVFLPFFDHAVVAAAIDPRPLPRGGRVSGVIFRPPNRFGLAGTAGNRLDALRRWATYLLARRLTRAPLLTLDELAPTAAVGRLTGVLRYLPDPAPDLAFLARPNPGARPDGRAVVLLFGALAARKGIFQALSAWELLPPGYRARHVLRLVGKLTDTDRTRFMHALAAARHRSPDARIELDDRFVSDEDLAAEVRVAAIVLAPYQNHVGSSGVLHWAVAAKKPLLTQNSGLIGYQVTRYGLGLAVDCSDPARIAEALLGTPAPCHDAADIFSRQHNPAQFTGAILDSILAQ